MALHLYSTLAKKKVEFIPLKDGEVRVYTCGPTVYGRPHIGNYSSFLMADLLCRWLECTGYVMTHVKNITDVGHLVADDRADAGGEDKIERQAKEEKVDPLSIAEKYTEQYLADERALHLREPEHRPRATETIHEMITIVTKLLKLGCAYETEDAIYFDVPHFKEYGKLSGNTLDKLGKLQEGVRIDVAETKKHPADFALWKKCVGENAHHVLRWSFPEGERLSGEGEDGAAGFPGWHIECSAMSTKFLGEQIDIHTGGEDNIFPHHECEIAQSECASGKQFVRYWLHKRRVNFSDSSTGSGQVKKMSKSLGNVLTLDDITAKGFDPLDLRFFFLATHYRSHTSFTWKGLEDARKARGKIGEWIKEVKREPAFASGATAGRKRKVKRDGESDVPEKYLQKFQEAMDDDLNTPEAIAAIFEVMTWSRREGIERTSAIDMLISLLERTFACFEVGESLIPEDVLRLVTEREAARKSKDFALSDRLRDAVLEKGFIIEDLPECPKVVEKGIR